MFYKKRCKNRTYIKENDLNKIVINEVMKRYSFFELDRTKNKLIDYYKLNNEDMQKIKKYKNEIEKLERKKSVLYKKKCDKYITIEEFKIEYKKVKNEILKFNNLIKEFENNNYNNLEEKTLEEIINYLKNGKFINNKFLKDIINRIDVYSKNKIEITFNL